MNYITNIDTSILPYNDKYMKYDLTSRQYIPTQDAVIDLLGIDLSGLGSPTAIDAFIKECSDDIYYHIYDHTAINQQEIKLYTLAKYEVNRQILLDAMLGQIRYAKRSSANLLKDMHGVNIEKGRAISINQLRGEIGIAKNSHTLLAKSGLLFSGSYGVPNIGDLDDGSY